MFTILSCFFFQEIYIGLHRLLQYNHWYFRGCLTPAGIILCFLNCLGSNPEWYGSDLPDTKPQQYTKMNRMHHSFDLQYDVNSSTGVDYCKWCCDNGRVNPADMRTSSPDVNSLAQGYFNIIFNKQFRAKFSDWYLRYLLWNSLQINGTGLNWRFVSISSDNTRHHLSQCWNRFMSPNGVTMGHWVISVTTDQRVNSVKLVIFWNWYISTWLSQ